LQYPLHFPFILGGLSYDCGNLWFNFPIFFKRSRKSPLTFNEPQVVAALGYDNGIFAPGRCSAPFGNCTAGNSATEPYIVAHNLLISHATAVKIYREKYQVRIAHVKVKVSHWVEEHMASQKQKDKFQFNCAG